ncbi:hypothetical protein EPYR_03155 [Erwinia pyrifoliae DSM 12163]|nr:hypothetical protein EPYR_03155 [Erwinia pyrifoliae DSM 12163]
MYHLTLGNRLSSSYLIFIPASKQPDDLLLLR